MLNNIPLLLAFCLSVSAALLPRQTQYPCTFVLNAVGTVNGSVVQDTVGENRIGGTYPQSDYYISNGTLIDSLNHHCVIMPSFQFQCITGSNGASSFSFANDGNLMQGEDEDWWACPAPGPGGDGSYNIFSCGLVNRTACHSITLRTGGLNCSDPGPITTPTSSSATFITNPVSGAPTSALSISSASSISTQRSGTTAGSTNSCPKDISSGEFQFPHLIVPVSSEDPDHSFGNSYSAYISPINSTLFNFDIPSAVPYNGTCALIFLFPFGGATYFSGTEEEEGENGGLNFALLIEVASANATYNTASGVELDYGRVEVDPGYNYTVATFFCDPGSTKTYEASSDGNVELDYFQQSGPNPMGLYIVPCDLGSYD